MENKKTPNFVRSALWSYDGDKIDIEKDKKIIIDNILNHGTDEQIRWLFKTYSVKEIRDIVRNPSKGFWYPQSLNYWLVFLKIRINKETYKNAIKKIYPQARIFNGSQ